MSLSVDPSPPADPAALPTDPVAYRRRGGEPKVMGPFFWGLMTASLVFILGGIAVVVFGPQLIPAKTPVAATVAAHSDAHPAEPPAAMAPQPMPADIAAPPAQVGALSQRLDRLEEGQKRNLNAAGAALATASLVQAAQSSQPFSGELGAVATLLPDSDDVAALRRISLTGAPTRAGLAASFNEAAGKAAVAARAPQGDGFSARLARALASVVTVRRVDHVTGDGPDAVLARAGLEAQQGDLEGSLRELARLSPRGREAMDGWRAQAQARVDIDRRVAAIRAQAVRDLTQSMAANP